MPLVEWTRLEPGQVEAVTAMLVNREHPTSVRITPSRGDGGVDILLRGGASDGGDVVFQIKRFAEGLDSRQKASITDSFETLRADPRWTDLDVTSWRLVTPWNPSPEAEVWLQELGEPIKQVVWHGLDFVEQLAAKYPDVIDYYLHDGADRIRAAQAEVITLMGLERVVGDAITHDELSRRVKTALCVLDHDPHYRFEHRFGAGEPPRPHHERPGLALHTLKVAGDGRWIAIDVIARCAASTDERPITIKGSIPIGEGSTVAQDWDDFMTFGAPFSAEGASGEIDAPGGVGGPFENATMFTGPAEQDGTEEANRELLFEALSPSGEVLAHVNVDRVERSEGTRGGVRAVLRAVGGVFEIESRFNLVEGSEKHQLRVHDIEGLPVKVACESIQMLSEMRPPNRVRISHRHGSPKGGVTVDRLAFERDDETTAGLDATRRILEVLSILQDHSGTVIRTPNFKSTPPGQFKDWRIAASLLSGNEIEATFPGDHAMLVDLSSEVEVGETLTVSLPHQVRVGDQHVDLGRRILILDNPTLLSRTPVDGAFQHALTTPDMRVRFRWHDPTEDP